VKILFTVVYIKMPGEPARKMKQWEHLIKEDADVRDIDNDLAAEIITRLKTPMTPNKVITIFTREMPPISLKTEKP